MNEHSEPQANRPNPALKDLEILLGDWDLSGYHPGIPEPVRGHARIEWAEDGAFLAWHLDFAGTLPPSGIIMIGRDGAVDTYTMLYFDERGVSRIYEMSLAEKEWKYWRNSPGFSQRMTGRISPDQTTISFHGELSRDGSTWEQDLDLTLKKVGDGG